MHPERSRISSRPLRERDERRPAPNPLPWVLLAICIWIAFGGPSLARGETLVATDRADYSPGEIQSPVPLIQ